MTARVIKLADHANIPDGDLEGWVKAWAESMASGDYGEWISVLMVVETRDGLAVVSNTSGAALDKARGVGLLTVAANRLASGDANIEDLSQ